MGKQTTTTLLQTIGGLALTAMAASLGCQRTETVLPMVVTPVVQETILTPSAATDRLVGVASCTASGCHGGGKAGEIVGSEYNIWISEDPHAKAFSVLYDEASVRMLQLLDGKETVVPYQDDRCLACHSTTFAPPRDDHAPVISDGVGCEACHGPAERWLGPHVQGRLSAATKAQLGMWDTDQLSSRAKICADCHVGGPQREVNHDLIAAGHPRLQFELGAYFEALPKHWNENRDRGIHENQFDVRTWAVGQAISSQLALAQLARRATAGQAWPELSEWSCSACHHDLRDEQARQKKLADAGNLSGRSIAWDDWNHHLPRHYLRAIERAFRLKSTSGPTIEAEIEALQLLVQNTYSDRTAVAERAGKLATKLGNWAVLLEQATVDRRSLDSLSFFIAQHAAGAGHSSWSSSAQAYDALASMHQSRLELARAAGPSSDPILDKLTGALADLYSSLTAVQGASSRFLFQPQKTRASLNLIRELLPQKIRSP